MSAFEITSSECQPLPAYLAEPAIYVSDVSRQDSCHLRRQLGA